MPLTKFCLCMRQVLHTFVLALRFFQIFKKVSLCFQDWDSSAELCLLVRCLIEMLTTCILLFIKHFLIFNQVGKAKSTTTGSIANYLSNIYQIFTRFTHESFRAYPGSGFVVANTLAKWKKLEPNEIDFSQKVVSTSCSVFSSLPASSDFCHLLITFANSLDPDQAGHIVGPDLDPNCLTP